MKCKRCDKPIAPSMDYGDPFPNHCWDCREKLMAERSKKGVEEMIPANHARVTDTWANEVIIMFPHVQALFMEEDGHACVMVGNIKVELDAINGKNFQEEFKQWVVWQNSQTVEVPSIDSLNEKWMPKPTNWDIQRAFAMHKAGLAECYKCGYKEDMQQLEPVRVDIELKFQCKGGCKNG